MTVKVSGMLLFFCTKNKTHMLCSGGSTKRNGISKDIKAAGIHPTPSCLKRRITKWKPNGTLYVLHAVLLCAVNILVQELPKVFHIRTKNFFVLTMLSFLMPRLLSSFWDREETCHDIFNLLEQRNFFGAMNVAALTIEIETFQSNELLWSFVKIENWR